MSTRAQRYDAVVLSRAHLAPHLLRLTLSVPGLESTGIADEWVGLVVPGQFQVRYYTVRSWTGAELVLDVVVHDARWAWFLPPASGVRGWGAVIGTAAAQ